jgi:plasmid stabilization system protein ParE
LVEDSAVYYGDDAAIVYHTKVLQALARLGTFPELGRIDSRYLDGTRYLIVASHRIFYTIVANEILISRILASRRDPERT